MKSFSIKKKRFTPFQLALVAMLTIFAIVVGYMFTTGQVVIPGISSAGGTRTCVRPTVCGELAPPPPPPATNTGNYPEWGRFVRNAGMLGTPALSTGQTLSPGQTCVAQKSKECSNSVATYLCNGKTGKVELKGCGDVTSCPTAKTLVCGTNGKQYNNSCFANKAGSQVACQGTCPCKAPTTIKDARQIQPAPPTENGSYCISEYKPVCGTDGKTYSNACVAGRVSIACAGTCPCKL